MNNNVTKYVSVKSRMLMAVVCLTICLTGSMSLQAEEFAVGVYGVGASAQGDFGDNVDNAMPGIDVEGLFCIPETPISIGLQAGYLHYGNEHRNAAISETIPDVTVRVNRTNQILNAGLVLRYEQRYGKVIPHIDGMVGLNYIWTSTNINDRHTLIPNVTSTTLRDTAFAGGIGGGVMFEVYHSDEDNITVLLDTNMRYTVGGEATYLTEGDVTIDNQNVVHLNKHKTKTDHLDFRVGIVVKFSE